MRCTSQREWKATPSYLRMITHAVITYVEHYYTSCTAKNNCKHRRENFLFNRLRQEGLSLEGVSDCGMTQARDLGHEFSDLPPGNRPLKLNETGMFVGKR